MSDTVATDDRDYVYLLRGISCFIVKRMTFIMVCMVSYRIILSFFYENTIFQALVCLPWLQNKGPYYTSISRAHETCKGPNGLF